jgi:hypothetical protein
MWALFQTLVMFAIGSARRQKSFQSCHAKNTLVSPHT